MAENTGLRRSCSTRPNSILARASSLPPELIQLLLSTITSIPCLLLKLNTFSSYRPCFLILYSRRNRALPLPLDLPSLLSAIDQFSPPLSLECWQISTASVASGDRALSVRLSTLHAWSPTPPPFVRIPLTWCGQSESRGKGINRHSSESEYALKRCTPESKLSEEEEEVDRIYVILGTPLDRRSSG